VSGSTGARPGSGPASHASGPSSGSPAQPGGAAPATRTPTLPNTGLQLLVVVLLGVLFTGGGAVLRRTIRLDA
jgi:LPXTG-motif cell wall-anchored protein